MLSGAGARATICKKTLNRPHRMHDNRIASVGALKPVIRRHPRGNGPPITFAPGVLFLPGSLSAGVQLDSSRLQPTQQFG